jgi:hypothetical protein
VKLRANKPVELRANKPDENCPQNVGLKMTKKTLSLPHLEQAHEENLLQDAMQRSDILSYGFFLRFFLDPLALSKT